MTNDSNISERALSEHLRLQGKVEVVSKAKLLTAGDLSVFYTPGVGAVSSHLAEHPEDAVKYTTKGNTVAVISDGSAVLGLGNIGPAGAAPVMEGKAMIFKEFADVNAVPIVLGTQDTEEIIAAIKAIAPTFGGINLEDISAPRCFEIEERLIAELDIPVMHDDQHGTAIVVLAGLINAAKVTGKNMNELKIVMIGAGAAGVGVARLLHGYGVGEIIAVDRQGIIYEGRDGLNASKLRLAEFTNLARRTGSLSDALAGADVMIGVSGPNLVTREGVATMNRDAIIFALSNPVPEIMPDVARSGGAAVIATGRSDFPNQVNNALVFPGVFRGALNHKVTKITDQMMIAAAEALAGLVETPTADQIIPSIFDYGVVDAIAAAIR